MGGIDRTEILQDSMSITIDLSSDSPDCVQPLTSTNKEKANMLSSVLGEMEGKLSFKSTLPTLLQQDESYLIGLRVRTLMAKQGLFQLGQRGVVTDIKSGKIFVTMDNLPILDDLPEAVPMQRTISFKPNALFKYCEICS